MKTVKIVQQEVYPIYEFAHEDSFGIKKEFELEEWEYNMVIKAFDDYQDAQELLKGKWYGKS